MLAGKIEKNGTIRDRNNMTIGKVESDGTVRDKNNKMLGKVKIDGTVVDCNNMTIGYAKDVPVAYTAVFFFFCLKNRMADTDGLWMDSYGFIYSADGKRLLKGANVEGAYWIPEGVEEIEPRALLGCKIGTLHVPWTAHVHEHDQLAFSEDAEENEEMMPAVYFWTKEYANRDKETWAFEDDGEYRIDEHGVAYSLDGHRLLFTRFSFKDSEYQVPDGVVTICSMAFAMCRQFVTLIIPRSVCLIGDFVFGPAGGKIVIRDE